MTKNPSVKKDTNPKDAVGTRKVPLSTVPSGVIAEMGVAMLEGARKYGRHNYRAVGIRYSVYYDAAMRHLMAWWEGEDIDPDSGLSHITKALSTLAVLRDAQMSGKYTDDRPPRLAEGWVQAFNALAGEVIDRYPEPAAPYTAALMASVDAEGNIGLAPKDFTGGALVGAPHEPVTVGLGDFRIGDTVKDVADGLTGEIENFGTGQDGDGAYVRWHSVGLRIWYPLSQLALVSK